MRKTTTKPKIKKITKLKRVTSIKKKGKLFSLKPELTKVLRKKLIIKNKKRVWTVLHIIKLKKLVKKKGITWAQIARLLNRTVASVKSRASALRLTLVLAKKRSQPMP